MSAPTPAPGDDRPREGYYPDPSIPGYVRYWNGASWVPGTSRPAPTDGEPLTPPPGARPAAPAVEETGPHFFDEDPQPAPSGPERASGWGADGEAQPRQPGFGVDPRISADTPSPPAGHASRADGAAPTPPAEDGSPDPGGTFIFRRPVPGPAAVRDDGAMTFRPVPGQGKPGGDAGTPGTPGFGAHGSWPAAGPSGSAGTAGGSGGFGAQGPVGVPQAGLGGAGGPGAAGPGVQGPAGAPSGQSGPAAGSGFGAGKAAAARAAGSAQPPQSSPSAVAPSVPQQTGPQQGGAQQAAAPATPLTAGSGGGQTSWAQQVHRLAGGADEQPVAPWKPPVEDLFQAAARRQAAARPAGLGRRFAARLIDNLVLGAVTAAAAVPLGARAVDHVQQKIDEAKLSGRTVTVWLLDGTTGTSLGIVLAVLLVFGVLYEVLPTAKWGRTLGKKLCGLEVRDIEGHEPPTFGAALRRWLVYSVPGLLGIGVVGVLWCVFDRPWRQCWHDKAAHTFVAD
ncbi:RDD family protein [Streptomyces sp. NPDC007905]|uniref:RDD family protein n=1 Tax=Streptomyces sp. NPDC007905 TaxID=3364788 RepID=UPI0036ED15A2